MKLYRVNPGTCSIVQHEVEVEGFSVFYDYKGKRIKERMINGATMWVETIEEAAKQMIIYRERRLARLRESIKLIEVEIQEIKLQYHIQ